MGENMWRQKMKDVGQKTEDGRDTLTAVNPVSFVVPGGNGNHPDDSAPTLLVDDLNFSYPDGQVALRDVSLQISHEAVHHRRPKHRSRLSGFL